MDASEWWLADLRAEVSQGDIYADVPFLTPAVPLTHLQHAEVGKGRPGWAETSSPTFHKRTQRMHALGVYKPRHAILLSHDCEIDKAKDRPRFLLAPIAPIADLPEKTRTNVVDQSHLALAPLPDIPNIGFYYADLRGITSVPYELMANSSRVASMTDTSRRRLGAYLVAFLLRKRLDEESVHG